MLKPPNIAIYQWWLVHDIGQVEVKVFKLGFEIYGLEVHDFVKTIFESKLWNHVLLKLNLNLEQVTISLKTNPNSLTI